MRECVHEFQIGPSLAEAVPGGTNANVVSRSPTGTFFLYNSILSVDHHRSRDEATRCTLTISDQIRSIHTTGPPPYRGKIYEREIVGLFGRSLTMTFSVKLAPFRVVCHLFVPRGVFHVGTERIRSIVGDETVYSVPSRHAFHSIAYRSHTLRLPLCVPFSPSLSMFHHSLYTIL
jgi:hypothetical protein